MRRTIPALAALAATALLLSGCSAASDAPSEEASPNAAFPVSIESALGTATIPEEPERVVSIGWSTPDIAVALGVTPVAIEADTWAGDEDGVLPWLRDAIEENGEPLPDTFNVYPEIDMDAVVAADPDLILAPQSGLTQDQYDLLSKLAPTVAYPEAAWQTSWSEQIEIVAKALGKPDSAQTLIDDMTERLADVAADHPEFADLSFAYVYTGKPGALDIYNAGDPRVDILTALGFTEVPALADLEVTEGTFTSTVGLENADLLDDVDVLFTWYNSEEEKKTVASQELWQQIPAVQRGSVVEFVSNRQLGMATSAVTPLSLPWALDTYVPLIEEGVSHVDG